jgi:hypothetical protein
MVVGAARQWWAARRLRRSKPGSRPKGAQKAIVARLGLVLPLALVGAILFCAATGFTATRISRGQVEAGQRAALQQALDKFHAQFINVDAPDDVQLRQIARRSRLADLRFDASPIGEVGRTLQSLHDPRVGASSAGSVGQATADLSPRWTGCGAPVGVARCNPRDLYADRDARSGTRVALAQSERGRCP